MGLKREFPISAVCWLWELLRTDREHWMERTVPAAGPRRWGCPQFARNKARCKSGGILITGRRHAAIEHARSRFLHLMCILQVLWDDSCFQCHVFVVPNLTVNLFGCNVTVIFLSVFLPLCCDTFNKLSESGRVNYQRYGVSWTIWW